jgi:predicted MFS family arabinose efflux permease
MAEHIGWRGAFLVFVALYATGVAALYTQSGRVTRLGQLLDAREPMRGGSRGGTLRVLLRDRFARCILVAIFVEGALVLGPYAFVSTDLHHRLGVEFGTVGGLLALFGAGGMIYVVRAGWWVRTLGQRGLVRGGAALTVLALAGLGFAPGALAAALAIAALGLGYYMIHNTLQLFATQLAPAVRGLAVSLFALLFFAGQTVGVALNGWSYDHYGRWPGLAVSIVGMPLLAVWIGARIARRASAAARAPA